VTHHAKTVPSFALDRVARGLPLAKVILVPTGMDRQAAVEQVELVILAHMPGDWQIGYIRLPLG
jgi:hypothetical protein